MAAGELGGILEHVAEVVVGIGIVGLKLQGPLETGDGVGHAALDLHADAETVVGVGEVGLQLQARR